MHSPSHPSLSLAPDSLRMISGPGWRSSPSDTWGVGGGGGGLTHALQACSDFNRPRTQLGEARLREEAAERRKPLKGGNLRRVQGAAEATPPHQQDVAVSPFGIMQTVQALLHRGVEVCRQWKG
jgi:hypothetical protein